MKTELLKPDGGVFAELKFRGFYLKKTPFGKSQIRAKFTCVPTASGYGQDIRFTLDNGSVVTADKPVLPGSSPLEPTHAEQLTCAPYTVTVTINIDRMHVDARLALIEEWIDGGNPWPLAADVEETRHGVTPCEECGGSGVVELFVSTVPCSRGCKVPADV